MPNTGKLLEGFVARIEKLVLPQGLTISSNEKIYNDDGVQIAEFDIEISGRVGTTDFKWLIECRDRPADGAAPGSWIEQLVGRRRRFNFDKVIAVSTTGFTEGAVQFAKESGIEIRTVTEADIDQVSNWFLIDEMTLFRRGAILEHSTLLVDEAEQEALQETLTDALPGSKILLSTLNGEYTTLAIAFANAASEIDGLYDDITPNGGSKKVALQVDYPDDNSHFVVGTKLGNVRIKEIFFEGELRVTTDKLPLLTVRKYENMSNGEIIATSASFNLEVDGLSKEISFNRIEGTGEIRVVLSTPKHKS